MTPLSLALSECRMVIANWSKYHLITWRVFWVRHKFGCWIDLFVRRLIYRSFAAIFSCHVVFNRCGSNFCGSSCNHLVFVNWRLIGERKIRLIFLLFFLFAFICFTFWMKLKISHTRKRRKTNDAHKAHNEPKNGAINWTSKSIINVTPITNCWQRAIM